MAEVRNLVPLCGALLMAAACGGSSSSPTTPSSSSASSAATFSRIQSELLTRRCVDHHGNAGVAGELDLRSPQSYANLVNAPSSEVPLFRVAPGDPEASYLVHKLEGRATIVGTRMPQSGLPLSDEQIDLVRRWIEAGALND